jgi:hypothetical protein
VKHAGLASKRGRLSAVVARKLCAVGSEPAYERGLCKFHYRRWHRMASAGRLFTRGLPDPAAEIGA